MLPKLHTLSFDILYQICDNLDPTDIAHLSLTCRNLRIQLQEETLCRRAILTHAMHTKEAEFAIKQKITFQQALQRLVKRRGAFATAMPYSACIIGKASSYTYSQGILCYLLGDTVRVLDVHGASRQELVLDLSHFWREIACREPSPQRGRASLLNYSDGILVLMQYSRLLALDVRPGISLCQRLRLMLDIEEDNRLFVRNTASYLVWGTHSATGDHGYHEWELQIASLDPNKQLPDGGPIQLHNFAGSDVGSSVAFTIHGNFFYALSNVTSFDVEEIDYTSFFDVRRFPLDDPYEDGPKTKQLFRRAHDEGPINDAWTTLGFQVHEATNELLIVEGRREWLVKFGSEQRRTYYLQDIDFNNLDDDSQNGKQLPTNDPLTMLIDEHDKPNYGKPKSRAPWQVHDVYGREGDTAPSFTLSKTVMKGYNLSANSFFDLVEDPDPNEPCSSSQRLRLRVGSRLLNSPLDHEANAKVPPGCVPTALRKPELDPEDPKKIVPRSEEAYRHRSIRMWPPNFDGSEYSKSYHKVVQGILNPISAASGTEIEGIADERSIIYRPVKDYDRSPKPLILINFDEGIQLSGLTRLSDGTRSGGEKPGICQQLDEGQTCNAWAREESAMYLRLGKGAVFW